MEWLTYTVTVLGLTVPLAIGFVVIGLIIAALVILGGEVYSERDKRKRLQDPDDDGRTFDSPSREYR